MSVIQFKDVTKIYQRSHLGRVKKSLGLESLSLDIQAGEVFGLLGLNGSGKTTTIKLMLGLLRPTQGSIFVMGHEMPDLRSLAKVGYLPEAAYLNKFLTGREAIKIYARLAGIPKADQSAAVENILAQVGMQRVADKRMSDYSKGMLQRISIAQALVHNPDILIMDEPISGLDPLAIKEIRELIMWLKSKGKTVFLSSHNMAEVERVCDRIGILVAGKLVSLIEPSAWRHQDGKLEEIFTTTVTRTESIGALSFK